MKDSPIIVKKSTFLECVKVTYENASDSYLITLANALMILYKSRKDNSEDFSNYKGFVVL